jgi:hypothetical protein
MVIYFSSPSAKGFDSSKFSVSFKREIASLLWVLLRIFRNIRNQWELRVFNIPAV